MNLGFLKEWSSKRAKQPKTSVVEREQTRVLLGPEARAERLRELLQAKPTASVLSVASLFNEVSDLLATDDLATVCASYGAKLADDIKARFAASADHQRRLLSLLAHGAPTIHDDLNTALRPRSVLPGDDKRAIALLESASPEERKAIADGEEWKDHLRPKFRGGGLGASWRPYADAMVANGERELADQLDGTVAEKQDRRERLIEGKKVELLALVKKLVGDVDLKSHAGALVRSAAMERLSAWAERHPAEVKKAVWDQVKGGPLATLGIGASHARELGALLDPGGVFAEIMKVPLDGRDEELASLFAHTARKGQGPLKSQSKAIEKIEDLGEKGRGELRALLAGSPVATEDEFAKELPTIRANLPEDNARGAWNRRALLPLRPGAPKDVTRVADLEDLVFPRAHNRFAAPSDSTSDAQTEDARRQEPLLAQLARLAPQDFALVRLHDELLAQIEKTLGTGSDAWKWVVDFLQLRAPKGGLADAVAEPAKARAGHQAIVELAPLHWARLLERELAGRWDATEVFSLVQQAWNVAGRRRFLAPDAASLPEAARRPGDEALDPKRFLGDVYRELERIAPEAARELEKTQLQPARAALTDGHPIPTAVRLGDARYDREKIGARVSHGTRKDDEILRAAEECEGIQLLSEWTNIAELRELRAQFLRAQTDEARAEVERRAASFVVQLHADIHAILDDQKRTGELELAAKLLERLARAFEEDFIFRGAVKAEGAYNTEQLRVQLLALASLVHAKATRDGSQLRGLSTKADQRQLETLRVRRGLNATLQGDASDETLTELEGATGALELSAAQLEALKAKVLRVVTTAVGITVGVAVSAATFGATAPIAAVAAAVPAAFIKSFLATVPAILAREGVNLAMKGRSWNKGEAVVKAVRDVVLAFMTVGSGQASEAMNGVVEAAARDEVGKVFLETFTVSGVEVMIRKAGNAGVDLAVGEEFDAKAFEFGRIMVDVARDGASKGVTGLVADPTEVPGAPPGTEPDLRTPDAALANAPPKLAMEGFTGQWTNVGENGANLQTLGEETAVGWAAKKLTGPAGKEEEEEDAPRPPGGVEVEWVRQAIARGFSLGELRAFVSLEALIAQAQSDGVNHQRADYWAGAFAKAGITFGEAFFVFAWSNERLDLDAFRALARAQLVHWGYQTEEVEEGLEAIASQP